MRYDDPTAEADIAAALGSMLCRPGVPEGPELVLLCIGTDRSTGDALGPLVGWCVDRLHPPGVRVYGTLDHPVHASNLSTALTDIQDAVPDGVLLAVDACLGRLEGVGQVSVGSGPLQPGAGVNKHLPHVGHVHITGTVNVGGFMEYFVLQNTRLSLVVRMAEVIGAAIAEAARGFSALRGGEAAATAAGGALGDAGLGVMHGRPVASFGAGAPRQPWRGRAGALSLSRGSGLLAALQRRAGTPEDASGTP